MVRDLRSNTEVVDPRPTLLRGNVFEVRYRWAYLFRSHMYTKDPNKPRFGCVLCAHTDARTVQDVVQPLTVFEGVDKLINHIAAAHTGGDKWPGAKVGDEEALDRLRGWINVGNDGEDGIGVRQGWDLWLGVE